MARESLQRTAARAMLNSARLRACKIVPFNSVDGPIVLLRSLAEADQADLLHDVS